MKLLLATNNLGKRAELEVLLGGLSFNILAPAHLGLEGGPEETGATFEENAMLKARHYASISGILTLADDSGLEVDALQGSPGVLSARYAGANATDADRNRYLLDKLKGVPWERRTARFRCVVALVWPDGREETFEGSRAGYITLEPRGDNGFGYDPIFYVPELGKTFGQVEPEVKHRWSHRGQAARKAAGRLIEETKSVIGAWLIEPRSS